MKILTDEELHVITERIYEAGNNAELIEIAIELGKPIDCDQQFNSWIRQPHSMLTEEYCATASLLFDHLTAQVEFWHDKIGDMDSDNKYTSDDINLFVEVVYVEENNVSHDIFAKTDQQGFTKLSDKIVRDIKDQQAAQGMYLQYSGAKHIVRAIMKAHVKGLALKSQHVRTALNIASWNLAGYETGVR